MEHIHSSRVIVTGDININILDCIFDLNEYSCLLAKLGFLPAITKPTRLDSCLVFIRSKVDCAVGLVVGLAIIDHDLIILGLANLITITNHNRYKTTTDHSTVVNDLRAADWTFVMLALHNNKYTKRLNRSTFILKRWITKGILRCMVHRDKLHLDFRQHPDDPIRKGVYHRYRNFLINLLYSLK